jgi:hypothetical protein
MYMFNFVMCNQVISVRGRTRETISTSLLWDTINWRYIQLINMAVLL